VRRVLLSILILPAIGAMGAGMAAAADDVQVSDLPKDPTRPPIEGVLTDEGVECPAMRAADGTLYTLMGDLRGFKPNEPVCIVPEPIDMTYCLQGTTMHVDWIGPGPCPGQ
jgi:hypothetical protein